MTYKATLKVQFDTEFVNQTSYGVYDDEILPEEHYTFEIPAQDLNTIQLFRFFGTVARTMGHNEIGIMKGACSLAFNDMRSEEDMRKIADEFDLLLSEDYHKKLVEYDTQQDEDLKKMEAEIRDLKAKISRLENPENPQYTDEEMDAMTYQEWGHLIPGSYAAVQNGCKCPVMDNQEMPEDRKWVNGDCPLHGKLK
jgi:hypothetical protein